MKNNGGLDGWMLIGGRMKLQMRSIGHDIGLAVRIEDDGRLRGSVTAKLYAHVITIAEFFDDDASDEACERMKARLLAVAVLHGV